MYLVRVDWSVVSLSHLRNEVNNFIFCHFFSADDDFVDFWIVSTDYTDYSVVYRCVERDSAGACITPNAFIYSRIPQLSNDTAIVTAIDDTLDNLCVNKSALLSTQHTNG